MRKIAAFVVVVSLLAGGLWYSQRRTGPLHVSGFVEADDIRVGSRIGGRVARVDVEEGAAVTAGQVLFTLEPHDLLERKSHAEAVVAERRAVLAALEAGFRAEEIAQAKARRDQLAARLERLRKGPREEEIAQARARLGQLSARLDLLKNGARAEDLAAAKSQVDLAQAELDAAASNHRRMVALSEKSAVSREDLEAATEKLEVARALVRVRREELAKLESGTREEEISEAAARVEEARQALALLENGYRPEEVEEARTQLEEAEQAWLLKKNGARPEEVEGAKAALAAAGAELRAILRLIEELEVRAPTEGVVEAVELQPGDLVGAGAPALAILDLARLWVRAYVPEDRLGLDVGTTLPVSVDAWPGEVFRGRVAFVSRQAEFTPANVQTPEGRSKQVFRIRVVLEEGLDRLRPGMSADVGLEETGR